MRDVLARGATPRRLGGGWPVVLGAIASGAALVCACASVATASPQWFGHLDDACSAAGPPALVQVRTSGIGWHSWAREPEDLIRTIPGVRSFVPSPGPGWCPSPATRVLTCDESLAGEAGLLAQELDVKVAAGPPVRSGDVQLALDPEQTGGPEAYSITVHDGTVLITGRTGDGVFYGTRTLLQSVRSSGRMPEGLVQDGPDRPQRGLNLDIARKYYSPGWIKARLREMADLKLNQLGLHLSDNSGLRVESLRHPEVVAWPYLTRSQVRQIVALATSLHITVVPEIDSPGHLRGLLKAHPELQARDSSGTPDRDVINIADPRAARIIDDLVREAAPLFPGPYWHIGGDEYPGLAVSNPEHTYPALAAAARRRFGPGGRIRDLATLWLNDRAAIVRALHKQPRAWNDGITAGGAITAAQDILVDYWTGLNPTARQPTDYLNEGRELINFNSAFLYYVLRRRGDPYGRGLPTGRDIYLYWSPSVLKGHQTDPTDSANILGGSLALWCDEPGAQTPEQTALGIRPPLRALAQRLWVPGPPRLTWEEFTDLAGALG